MDPQWRILVVDDDPTQRRLLDLFLRKNHEMSFAEDLSAAREQITQTSRISSSWTAPWELARMVWIWSDGFDHRSRSVRFPSFCFPVMMPPNTNKKPWMPAPRVTW